MWALRTPLFPGCGAEAHREACVSLHEMCPVGTRTQSGCSKVGGLELGLELVLAADVFLTTIRPWQGLVCLEVLVCRSRAQDG